MLFGSCGPEIKVWKLFFRKYRFGIMFVNYVWEISLELMFVNVVRKLRS